MAYAEDPTYQQPNLGWSSQTPAQAAVTGANLALALPWMPALVWPRQIVVLQGDMTLDSAASAYLTP